MSKRIIKSYMIITMVVSVLMMLPIVYIARYNHVAADDYNYALLTHSAWINSHSVSAVIGEALRTAANTYYTWQGTYTSCFLFAMQPGIFGEKYYFLTTIIMLISIWGGNMIVFLYVLPRAMKLQSERLAFTAMWAMVSAYMVNYMPSPVQGLYWYNGAVHYTFFYLPLMALVGVYFGICTSGTNRKLLYSVIAGAIAGAVVAGGNFVSALLAVLVGFITIAYAIWNKKRPALICSVIVQMVTLAGFMISILAPGNDIRKATEGVGYDPVTAILKSIEAGILYSNEWFGLHTLIVTVALIPIIVYIVKRYCSLGNEFDFPMPVWISVLSLGLTFSMFAPSMYAMKFAGPARLLNLIWYVYVLVLILNIIYYAGWIAKNNVLKCDTDRISDIRRLSAVIAVFTFVVFAIVGVEKTTSCKAATSITSGEAKRYHIQNNERLQMYENGKGTDVVFAPYNEKPELLFYTDLSEDKNVWPNTSAAEYYGVKSVEIYH